MRLLLTCAVAATLAVLAGCGGSKTADASGNHDAGGPITEAKLGVKFYPGASIVTSGETDEVASANLRTPDAIDKVVAFYEKELGVKATGDLAGYQVTGQKDGKMLGVSINNDGATNVSIMRKK